MFGDAIIWTEGKTDWLHIMSAKRVLQIPLKLVLGGSAAGNQNLLRQCQATAVLRQQQPVIFVFDHDDSSVLSKLQGSASAGCEYKYWGNNTYSILLPIPPHRSKTDGVCIELYYRDSELRTSFENRHLFLSSEFNQRSGRHLKNIDLSVGIRKSLPVESDLQIRIIDDEVFNSSHENVALSKSNFAQLIFDQQGVFASFSFDSFRTLFDLIGAIVEHSNACGWVGFVQSATKSEALSLQKAGLRSIGRVGRESVPLPETHLKIGDRVRLVLDHSELLRETNAEPYSHAILLIVDSATATCVCPNNELSPNCAFSDGYLLSPHPDVMEDPLEVYEPRGLHTVYGILTREAPPSLLTDALTSSISVADLDHFISVLRSSGLDYFKVIKKAFYVE